MFMDLCKTLWHWIESFDHSFWYNYPQNIREYWPRHAHWPLIMWHITCYLVFQCVAWGIFAGAKIGYQNRQVLPVCGCTFLMVVTTHSSYYYNIGHVQWWQKKWAPVFLLYIGQICIKWLHSNCEHKLEDQTSVLVLMKIYQIWKFQ